MLSNGLETRLGSFSAKYEHFFEWLKVDSETEKPNRKAIRAADSANNSSVTYFIKGLLKKDRLIDYIENFILYQNQSIKIIAKNHQFLGVNNLMESVKKRKELEGKLGVFWHTQGSGKSFSMVMFTRKVKRKIPGNFSFVVITDREDLDTQIHKTFIKSEVIGPKDECRPKNARQLKEFLQTNKPFIFTLIHKFRTDPGEKYPELTTRDDIFVLVDEAHRTQYKDLAENMRRSMPKANYIAFTGTPLLGAKRLTNQWFGDYVSEYNFAQSIEDGSTVPLFYSRRVPEVWLTNDYIDDDIKQIIDELDLNEDEIGLLENSQARVIEVIKRDDRLDKIARDIAHHFPRRGFMGKGLVVSVDKYTAGKMYDKVQHYWAIEKQNIIKERNNASDHEERKKLTAMLDYMNKVEMAVVISEDADEKEKFSTYGLDIETHRRKMNEITAEGKDIEDRFKDPDDPLQLVFVCSMWLTGFDVPNLSTLYLDKPMKGHTLMQAIARANRVYPDKPCGIIVDYVNVFKFVKQALSQYATGDDGNEFPAKDVSKLIEYIDATIDETDKYFKSIGIDVDTIIDETDTFERLEMLRGVYDTIVSNDDTKMQTKVLLNSMNNLYEASKPEIFERNWHNDKFAPFAYILGLFKHTIDDEKVKEARLRMQQVLDSSIEASKTDDQQEMVIHQAKIIDLSRIDAEELKKEIRQAKYKAIEIDDLKVFLEKALEQMLSINITRQRFSQRFKGIVDKYNAGGSENEDYYEQLVELIKDLKEEDNRAAAEGLTEEELELFDLLMAGKKLTKAEEQQVKLSAKNLYKKLTEHKAELFVVDWYKDEQPVKKVEDAIEESLDADLPESYDSTSFKAKAALLLNHFIDMAVQGYGWLTA